jgi:4'-phosphopantetheinyl transferase
MHNDFESWVPVEPTRERLGRRLGEATVHVWLLSLDRPTRPMSEFAALLTADERERAERFHFERDRRRFIAGRGQLRLLLGAYLERDPAALKLSYGPAGKPRLDVSEPRGRALDFNLSHSAGMALLGVTRGRRIGVDIEALRDTPDLDDVARQHFASEEMQARQALPAALKLDAFFATWTRKEAYLKAIGDGLLAPLDRFVVAVDPMASARLLSIEGSREAAARWTMWGGTPAVGFWGAAAVEGEDLSLETFVLAP